MANPSIRVAIVGGGLASASLGNALIHIPQPDVHIFESASEFSRRGIASGLSRNAQRALKQLVPSAMKLLRAAGAGSGHWAGTFVCDVGDEDSESSSSAEPALVIHRASLLRELLAPIPQEALHANKEVTFIQSTSTGESITFSEGQAEDFDAVIGADGVFSVARRHVMPDSEWAGTPSGFWDCINLMPYDRARAGSGRRVLRGR
ncbi:hypothetical protein F5Y08DRAFT_351528 [Xylaria arbuscula]|nr:hypothetical protein F5Y08DRAFT_351528 [Xylaria arbuscula]